MVCSAGFSCWCLLVWQVNTAGIVLWACFWRGSPPYISMPLFPLRSNVAEILAVKPGFTPEAIAQTAERLGSAPVRNARSMAPFALRC